MLLFYVQGALDRLQTRFHSKKDTPIVLADEEASSCAGLLKHPPQAGCFKTYGNWALVVLSKLASLAAAISF